MNILGGKISCTIFLECPEGQDFYFKLDGVGPVDNTPSSNQLTLMSNFFKGFFWLKNKQKKHLSGDT